MTEWSALPTDLKIKILSDTVIPVDTRRDLENDLPTNVRLTKSIELSSSFKAKLDRIYSNRAPNREVWKLEPLFGKQDTLLYTISSHGVSLFVVLTPGIREFPARLQYMIRGVNKCSILRSAQPFKHYNLTKLHLMYSFDGSVENIDWMSMKGLIRQRQWIAGRQSAPRVN